MAPSLLLICQSLKASIIISVAVRGQPGAIFLPRFLCPVYDKGRDNCKSLYVARAIVFACVSRTGDNAASCGGYCYERCLISAANANERARSYFRYTRVAGLLCEQCVRENDT
jgi:hypothetical protein